jgi:hypothetical protein
VEQVFSAQLCLSEQKLQTFFFRVLYCTLISSSILFLNTVHLSSRQTIFEFWIFLCETKQLVVFNKSNVLLDNTGRR